MKLFSGILLIVVLMFFFQQKKEGIIRMNQSSITSEIEKIVPLIIDFKDTLHNDTLYIHYDNEKIPVKYSRPLVTSVCIDGECRFVNIELYWNITGRYLGFRIPNEEFLSKTKHDPFSFEEYDRLHNLLADPISALANYTIDELVPEIDTSGNKVDAVSSATIAAVLDYIVEGAVYTTYTLWHIVYGPTKREIEKITTNKLDSELALQILNSNNLKDQVWVLNHISSNMEISPELQSKLMELIEGKDIYLAERSLNALKPEAINYDIQLELAKIFASSGFIQKRLIIQKLKKIKKLNPEVVQFFSSELNSLNGTLTKNLLELYKVHHVEDDYTVSEVAKLLKNENRYISNQAFKYLEGVEKPDKKVQKLIDKFKKNNS